VRIGNNVGMLNGRARRRASISRITQAPRRAGLACVRSLTPYPARGKVSFATGRQPSAVSLPRMLSRWRFLAPPDDKLRARIAGAIALRNNSVCAWA